jgi:hypothetical protein
MPMPLRRLILTAATAVIAIAALTLAVALPANAAAYCGRSGPNLQNGRVNDAAFTGPANQRSGSSTSCSAPGVLQPTDDALYFCWTSGTGGTWTYLRNLRTGVQGWVLDSLLRNNGSNRYCGF